jgi:AGZA family xanthine/uracil permease-like MFS transporter
MAHTDASPAGHDAPPGPPPEPAAQPRNGFDRYFEISARRSTVGREIRGGLATFFTMSYIVVLNPLILGAGATRTGPNLNMTQIAAATALVAGVMTILMGVVARFPLALAAGLGVNALVAYEIAPTMTWADAMGLVVIEGCAHHDPRSHRPTGGAVPRGPGPVEDRDRVGIGLFLTLIGLVDAGFVRTTGTAAPPIQLGVGNRLVGWPSLVFVIGLIVTLILWCGRCAARS